MKADWLVWLLFISLWLLFVSGKLTNYFVLLVSCGPLQEVEMQHIEVVTEGSMN
jgi:hypothetical protein